ncbi:MAG: hypothetical protein ACI3VB_05155 [Oscillospiraceae bacterium]
METEGYVVNAQDDYDEPEPLTELRTLENVVDLMLGRLVNDRLPLMHGEVADEYTGQELERRLENITIGVEALILGREEKGYAKDEIYPMWRE